MPATSVILGMCAGRWGRNGSSLRRISSPKLAKVRCRRDRSLSNGMPPAGDPQIPSTDRGIWPKKSRIGKPPKSHLDCENTYDREKVASTLAFRRQTTPERESGRDKINKNRRKINKNEGFSIKFVHFYNKNR